MFACILSFVAILTTQAHTSRLRVGAIVADGRFEQDEYIEECLADVLKRAEASSIKSLQVSNNKKLIIEDAVRFSEQAGLEQSLKDAYNAKRDKQKKVSLACHSSSEDLHATASLLLTLLLNLPPPRRAIVATVATAVAAPALNSQAETSAASKSSVQYFYQRADSSPIVAKDLRQRMEERAEEARRDIVYPPALIGDWQCIRQVQKVEGDAAEAEAVWRSLGGSGAKWRQLESSSTRFVSIPDIRRKAAIVDRGYEYAQRSGSSVNWSPDEPDVLRSASNAIVVITRDVLIPFQTEPPYRFRFSESVRITSLIAEDGSNSTRFAQLVRTLMPTDDGSIVGIEVVSSYPQAASLTSGAAPTSTTTSSLKLMRLPQKRAAAPPLA